MNGKLIAGRLILLAGFSVIGTASDAPASSEPASSVHSFKYDGPMPTKFDEAPELAARVARGELPPIAERIGSEPLIIPPIERIGKYGGTWRRAFTGPVDYQNIDRILHDHVIYYDLDGLTLVPHIAKSWDVSDDGRVFTFHLRKGMKWSDGHPFTADDFVFAYEKLILNDELVPVKPTWLRSGGELGVVSKIDNHTVRYSFARPYHVFLEKYAGLLVAGQSTFARVGTAPYAPAHYLKQFHPDFVDRDDLERLVKETGLNTWSQYFLQHTTPQHNPQIPVVAPWKTVQPITSQRFVLERNPYYWAIDPQGNQLPYIDRIAMQFASDLDVLNLRAIKGEFDMQHRHIQLAKVPVLKANQHKGNYRVLFWPGLGGTECGIFVNQTYDEDPEIARWLGNRDFRIALSISIDREAINETIFLGTGTPRAFLCPPNSPYYPGPELEHRYAQFDPAKANAILDRIGLDQKDAAGFRLRADGRRLVLSLAAVSAAFLDFTGIAEALAENWSKVGVKVSVTIEQRALHSIRTRSNQQHLSLWGTGGSENLWTYPPFTVPISDSVKFAPQTGAWHQSQGQTGLEPTGALKRLLDLFHHGETLPLGQRIAVGHQIWQIHSDNLFVIGTVGLSPAFNGVVVVKNNFRNVPTRAPNSATLQNPGIARTEQFFFDD